MTCAGNVVETEDFTNYFFRYANIRGRCSSLNPEGNLSDVRIPVLNYIEITLAESNTIFIFLAPMHCNEISI